MFSCNNSSLDCYQIAQHILSKTTGGMSPYLNASLVLIIAVPGFVFNMFSMLVLCTHPSFSNSFGRLSAVNSGANSVLLLLFIIWSTPLILLNYLPGNLHFLNEQIGSFSLFFAEITYNSGAFISINRLLAISMPVIYRKYFTIRMTNCIISGIFIFSFVYWCIYFIPNCSFYFDIPTNAWVFGNTSCGQTLGDFIDFKYNLTLLVISIISDFTTFLLLRGANLRMKKLINDDKKAERRLQKEIIFFLQSFTQTCGYILMFISFHVISNNVHTQFEIFISTTFAWPSAHAFGGLTVVLFNKEIRVRILKKARNSTVHSTTLVAMNHKVTKTTPAIASIFQVPSTKEYK